MKLSKQTKKSLQLNVTSLIDVMFILLLFFIVTSTFKDPNDAALDIILPKSNTTTEATDSGEEILFINKTGKISFAGKEVSLDELSAKFPELYKGKESKTILLKGDEEVSYQMFISVFDVLKANNVEKLILAAKGNQFQK